MNMRTAVFLCYIEPGLAKYVEPEQLIKRHINVWKPGKWFLRRMLRAPWTAGKWIFLEEC